MMDKGKRLVRLQWGKPLLPVVLRSGWGDNERNVNRIILEHRSNYELATITVYTAERSPEEIGEEIIRRISGIVGSVQ